MTLLAASIIFFVGTDKVFLPKMVLQTIEALPPLEENDLRRLSIRLRFARKILVLDIELHMVQLLFDGTNILCIRQSHS